MSMGVDDDNIRSTPKLCLSRVPCNKPKQLATNEMQMLTPPLHPHLSIPFQWEEAPGKPRFPSHDAARCLDLPPRLTHEFTIMSSSPLACTFSFRRRMGKCGTLGASKRWRWRKDRGTFDLSQTLGDFLMTETKINVKNKMGGGLRRVFHFSTMLDIYARFKQAIPWRRRR